MGSRHLHLKGRAGESPALELSDVGAQKVARVKGKKGFLPLFPTNGEGSPKRKGSCDSRRAVRTKDFGEKKTGWRFSSAKTRAVGKCVTIIEQEQSLSTTFSSNGILGMAVGCPSIFLELFVGTEGCLTDMEIWSLPAVSVLINLVSPQRYLHFIQKNISGWIAERMGEANQVSTFQKLKAFAEPRFQAPPLSHGRCIAPGRCEALKDPFDPSEESTSSGMGDAGVRILPIKKKNRKKIPRHSISIWSYTRRLKGSRTSRQGNTRRKRR
ncbi:hypothetical protein BSKO_02755 [Bryopsis sp. KO-2023]|nr:hypothetical protein BSKO_02755 [Bryopsis sp. KO-2023]